MNDRIDKFSIYLFMVIFLNIHDQPFLSFLLVSFYLTKNIRLLFEKDNFYISFISKFIKISALLIFTGIILGFIYGNSPYEIFKDTWYYIKIPTFFLFGYIIFKKFSLRSILYTFFIASVLGIVSFFIRFFYLLLFNSINFSDIRLYRWSIPEFPFEFILLLIIITFYKNDLVYFNSQTPMLRKIFRYFIVFLILTIVISTFSRTYLICTALTFIFYKVYKVSFKKIFLLSISIILISIIILSFLDFGFTNALIAKFESTKSELFSFSFFNKSSIMEGWRAYEVFIGLSKFFSGSITNYLFGFGFGALTDLQLKYPVALGSMEFYEIPIFHNGFLYTIIKSGIMGFLLYLIFLIKSVYYSKKSLVDNENNRYIYNSIVLLIVIFFLSSFAITGLFHIYKFNTSITFFSVLLFNIRERHLNTCKI